MQKFMYSIPCSASVGETLIGLKIQEPEEKGLSLKKLQNRQRLIFSSQDTWFVLENLDTLRKTGCPGTVKALVATALKIKPVMWINRRRHRLFSWICARGTKKALVKCINSIEEKKSSDPQERRVGIAHRNSSAEGRDGKKRRS